MSSMVVEGQTKTVGPEVEIRGKSEEVVMRLSEGDFSVIRALRAAEVLADTDAHKLSLKRRFVGMACADGDRSPELYDFHRGHGSECIHLPNRNGGALVLAPSSPIANRGGLQHCDCAHYELLESCQMKLGENATQENPYEVILYAHFPCAAAVAFQIPLLVALEYLIEAKDEVRRRIPHARPTLFFQVDYDGHNRQERFKTYFFDRDKYKTWREVQKDLVA